MKRYLLLLLLAGCMETKVPDKIHHDGNITTTNVIRIEIVVPPEITAAFNTNCGDKCSGEQGCVDKCNASQISIYTNQILNLISQFQQTIAPTAGE